MHIKQTEPTEWKCTVVAVNLPLRLCEMTNGLTVLLFSDTHVDIGLTLNYTVPAYSLLDVEPYNADIYITGNAGSYYRSMQELCN